MMKTRRVTVFSDWPFNLSLLFLAMLATSWSVGAWNRGGSLSRDQLAVGSICLAFFVPIAAWRYAVIRRVNSDGKTVDGIVRSISFHAKGGDTVYVSYDYEGSEVKSRFTWMGPGDTPERGDHLTLLIDPASPTRCYVIAVQRGGSS